MNERILHVLEYQKIIDRLNNHTETSLGKDLVSKIKPSTDMLTVERLQRETDEAGQVVRLHMTIPLGGIFDIRESLKRSAIGGVLSTSECLDVANTVYGGRQVKHFIDNIEEDFPILKELVEGIMVLRDLEQSIKNCIDDNGHVMDSATSKLRSIRSSIRTFESRVRDQLDNYTRNRSNMLSDAIVTIRNGRYVLPVKHEHRNAIGGIVHDQSASGQTLFMEPQAVVNLNNQLQAAKLQEKQEIEEILRTLSEQIGGHEAYLQENVRILAEIDCIYARGKLGREMRAAMPKINNQGIIKMKQARHPLIPDDIVVANDIEIGETYTTILITGPNTGGKTVVLKMVGLCTLMAQSGLQIPAHDGCEIAVFDNVFADIGDEQSIEQSLSTFSSHMTNIVKIVDEVDDKTLVLFDELGAGTDPQEGAALAMSILDEVVSRDARVIATTHYPELKAYGYNRKNVINASVEFNIETLKPTYRLLIGVPGRSNAFDISKRLGLNETIIERARGHIDLDSKSVENMITSLEASKKAAEEDYLMAKETLAESEELRSKIEAEWQQLEKKRESLYKAAEEKAEKALKDAREEAELIITEIRSMKTNTGFKEHEWIEAKKMLEDASLNLSSKQPVENKPKDESKLEITVGDEIKLLTLNQVGTVLEKLGAKEYLIQVGAMRVKAKRNSLQIMKQPKKVEQKPVAMVRSTSTYRVRAELDLRGERYDAAIAKVDKYIDDALLAGHSQVIIIHGKGTGALRTGVQEFAASHPSITSFREGDSGEGGNGVTVIEFG